MVILFAPLLSMRVCSGLPQQLSVILTCSGVVATLTVGEPAGVVVAVASTVGDPTGISGVAVSDGTSVGTSVGVSVGMSVGVSVGTSVGVSTGTSVASGEGVPSLDTVESSAYAVPVMPPDPIIGATSSANTEAIVNHTRRRRNIAVPIPMSPSIPNPLSLHGDSFPSALILGQTEAER